MSKTMNLSEMNMAALTDLGNTLVLLDTIRRMNAEGGSSAAFLAQISAQ